MCQGCIAVNSGPEVQTDQYFSSNFIAVIDGNSTNVDTDTLVKVSCLCIIGKFKAIALAVFYYILCLF